MKLSILLSALTLCQIQVGHGGWLPCYRKLRTERLCFSPFAGSLFISTPPSAPATTSMRMCAFLDKLSRLAGGFPSRGSQGGSLLRDVAITRMQHIYPMATSTGGRSWSVGHAERDTSSLKFKRILDGVQAISHTVIWLIWPGQQT